MAIAKQRGKADPVAFTLTGSSDKCAGDAGGTSLEASRIMAPADLAPGAASPEITAPSGRTYRSYAATALMQVLTAQMARSSALPVM